MEGKRWIDTPPPSPPLPQFSHSTDTNLRFANICLTWRAAGKSEVEPDKNVPTLERLWLIQPFDQTSQVDVEIKEQIFDTRHTWVASLMGSSRNSEAERQREMWAASASAETRTDNRSIMEEGRHHTPLWKGTQDRFWIPARIPVANDQLGSRLQ